VVRSDDLKSLLQKEYEHCASGYNSRDSIVPNEIISMFLFFGILAAFLGFVSTVEWPKIILIILISGIVLAGFFVLGALFLDMAANISCKVALRKRMEDIENIIRLGTKPIDKPLGVWSCINSRPRPSVERLKDKLFLNFKKQDNEKKYDLSPWEDSPYFIYAGLIICVVWVLIGFFTLGWNTFFRFEPPSRPSTLTANAVTAGRVELTWKDNANNETGYLVERAIDSGFATQLTGFYLESDSSTYIDSSCITQNQYYYRVIAVKGKAESS